MNKSELIERVSGRIGDQKASIAALDAMVTEIENAVSAGDKVNISGFGVFERRERAARTSRNPRTGELIQVEQTSVPVFRPGTTFKTMVSGEGKGRPGRAQAKGPQSKTQPSRARPAAKAQPAKAQASAKASQGRAQKAQPTLNGRRAKAQQSKASGRAQSSYARQSSYAQPSRAQSGYARTGSTAKRQTARAR